MKKLLSIILTLLMVFAITLTVHAETASEDAQAEAITEEAVNGLVATFTTSGVWVSIGGVLISAVTVIFAFFKLSKPIKKIATLIKSKADKASIENAVSEAKAEFKAEFETVKGQLTAENKALENELKSLTKSLAFIINYSNNINPHAKNIMIAGISAGKLAGEDVSNFLGEIENEVEKCVAAEIKPNTPYLDSIEE